MDYEPIIRTNLEKVGFTPDQIGRVLPYLKTDAEHLSRDGTTKLSNDFFDYERKTMEMAKALGVDHTLVLQAALSDRGMLSRNADTVRFNVQTATRLLGVPFSEYVNAIMPVNTHLFGRVGETINDNIRTSAAAVKMTVEEYLPLAYKQPSLFAQDGDKVKAIVSETAKKLGITQAQYIKAGKKEPSLFYKNPETTYTNASGCAAAVGLSLKQYMGLLMTQGQEQLLARAPETFESNIVKTSALLGISREQYTKVAAKRMTMLAYDPETLAGKVDTMSELLGIQKEDALKACMDAPPLFTADMQRINNNVRRLAEFMNVPKITLAKKLAREGAQAMYQDPETVNARIEKVCELTGIEKAKYVEMTMARVNLLWRAPETVAHNLHLMQLFNKKAIIDRDMAEFYTKKPDMLAVADTNFHLRYLYACMTGVKNETSFGLLRATRGDIERALVEHMGYNPDERIITRPVQLGDHQPRDEKRHTAFVGLIRRGILSGYEYKPTI